MKTHKHQQKPALAKWQSRLAFTINLIIEFGISVEEVRKKYTRQKKEAAIYAERMHAALSGTLTKTASNMVSFKRDFKICNNGGFQKPAVTEFAEETGSHGKKCNRRHPAGTIVTTN